MSIEAPERIWAQDAQPGECDYIGGGWWDAKCGNTQYPDMVEYVRADIHQAEIDRLTASLETARAADAASESRSWPEDFQHENGMYTCTCVSCGGGFIGYKRRVTCRICAQKEGDT